MNDFTTDAAERAEVDRRARAIFDERSEAAHRRTDRLFALLLMLQWLAAIAAALFVSPAAWSGPAGIDRAHLAAAIWIGLAIVGPPIALVLVRAGESGTRYCIALAQMLIGALLIHLTGGRIETHFHVFGSLAFLAIYRDWGVLAFASAVVALDHYLRGAFWPRSVFGAAASGPWRWAEHAGWVVFEDAVLIYSCLRSTREMRADARRQAELERLHGQVERQVEARTAELKESETRKATIFESALDGIITMDHRGLVVELNRAAESMFGLDRSDAVGRPLGDLIIPPALRAAHREGLARYMATGGSRVVGHRVEIPAIRGDGSEFPVDLAINRVDRDGEPLFIAFIRDITGRKQAEEGLRRAKEAAEAANRAKSEFLANMSHEIRTPMNGVLGMTELALETELTPRQREYLGLARSSAEGLLTVINDILDFSKIEAGKLALESSPFGLRDALEETLRTLASRAHAKGLELACRIAPGVPDALVGDPARLRQVVVNLVGNAIKFTGRGEVVVSVDSDPDAPPDIVGVAIRVAVADTGIGIEAGKLAAIFAPFEQADGSTTRRYGGTGLGLSISARLVELMGGRIWVESEPGRGSTFRFVVRLGRSPDAVPGRSAAGARPPALERTPILVVDDNATNRLILVETLASWGARPVAVADGPAALVALRAASTHGEPFAAALVDGMMPGMDGLELAGVIRRDPAHDGLAMLLLTSAGPPDDPAICAALRISACLTKPVRQSELFDALASALDSGPAVAVAVAVVAADPDPPAAPISGGLRVLLAEDHPINRKVAVAMLEGLGHSIAVAADGSQALAALDAGEFDVVLMDVQMPVLDGFEATAAIRSREASTGRRTPIIALTAHAMKGDRERCLDAGFDAYLPKPIRRAELVAALETLGSPVPTAS